MPDVVDHLNEWVGEGLLSADQATAIRSYEEGSSPGRPTAILEVLGYVGAVFVLVAGLLIVIDLWPDMSRVSRVAMAGTAAIVLIAAGLIVTRADHPRIRRVGSALLLLSLVPTGVAIGLIAESRVGEEAASLYGFAAATIVGLLLYLRDRQNVAQHAGLFVATMGTVLLATVVNDNAEEWLPGLLLLLAGVGWIVLASFEALPPRTLGEVFGGIGALFGSISLVSSLNWEENDAALVVMAGLIGVAVVAIVIGVAKDRIFVVVSGMVGLIIFLPWLINEALGENIGAPIALLVAGTLLIGSAVYLSKRRRR